jgi:hypothetical protein
MSFHPTNHDLLFILTTLGIHCVDLGQIGVNGYLNTIQTPLLKFTSATCFTFQPTSTPNQQSIQDFIYLGTNDGSIAKLEVTIPVNASNLNQTSTTNQKPTQSSQPELITKASANKQPEKTNTTTKTTTKPVFDNYETYQLFDESISKLQIHNDLLFVATQQGDMCSLLLDLTLQKNIFTGTQQPVRSFDIKTDHNNANMTRLVACGDDGLIEIACIYRDCNL